uniref:Uncharacterized protein n=1 Tax=Nelumbo nucifera TaxID=4432 RepID=A0A822ZPT1_NELNU|nr:TPA_asm: hypothetical protein HUJ06_003771 [Nelumbo nucifera]
MAGFVACLTADQHSQSLLISTRSHTTFSRSLSRQSTPESRSQLSLSLGISKVGPHLHHHRQLRFHRQKQPCTPQSPHAFLSLIKKTTRPRPIASQFREEAHLPGSLALSSTVGNCAMQALPSSDIHSFTAISGPGPQCYIYSLVESDGCRSKLQKSLPSQLSTLNRISRDYDKGMIIPLAVNLCMDSLDIKYY